MRLCVFTEPQEGASYDDLLKVAQRTEECGFEGFFRSDHFLSMGGDGLPGPTDSWLTLAALAVQTSRIRLGTLVSSATFRLPGPLAIAVAQADQMSGGRIELGLGAGWFEGEHAAYGIPFPPVRERFDRLEEQLAIITGLWRTPVGERFTFHGDHYRLTDSPALPKPAQTPAPPVIVGGAGPKRTPALAARYADEFNVPFRPVDTTREMYERVREACAARGREVPIVFSAAHTVACGRTPGEAKARAERIGLTGGGVSGTPSEVVDQIGQYAELGATRFFLQILDLSDLDHLDLLASEVAPQLP
jgi:F420-dependent oxidoreductase-like protein